MLYRYKPDEGRNARQASFWLGEGMIFFGCYALSGTLDSASSGLRAPVLDGFQELPLLGVRLSASFLIAAALFAVGSFLWTRWLAKEPIADHLIEVEGEMRKVTWPTFAEASNSSIVVIVMVLILMGYLALSDFVLNQFFQTILWGRL
jgi:preprotein translocase subunit SecE